MTPYIIKQEMEFKQFVDSTLQSCVTNQLTKIVYHQLADRYFNTHKMILLYQMFSDIDIDNTGKLTHQAFYK